MTFLRYFCAQVLRFFNQTTSLSSSESIPIIYAMAIYLLLLSLEYSAINFIFPRRRACAKNRMFSCSAPKKQKKNSSSSTRSQTQSKHVLSSSDYKWLVSGSKGRYSYWKGSGLGSPVGTGSANAVFLCGLIKLIPSQTDTKSLW